VCQLVVAAAARQWLGEERGNLVLGTLQKNKQGTSIDIGAQGTHAELSKLYWIEYHLSSQKTAGRCHALATPVVLPWSSTFVVPPLLFCPFFINGLLSNFAFVGRRWGVLLSWLTCAFVVPLTIKMYQHSFSSFFLLI
jgi:hypothetical protein